MANSKRSGAFTLVEILVTMVVGSIVLALSVAIYRATNTRYFSAAQSFELDSHVTETMDWLLTDLRQTNLASVTVYPNDDNPQEPPGLSFAGATTTGEFKNLSLSQYGTPDWRKHTFYTLKPLPDSKELSQLIRYGIDNPQALPFPSLRLPSDLSNSTTRVITRAILSKGYSFQSTPSGVVAPAEDSQAPGGFSVAFLLKDGSESSVNPSKKNLEQATQNTPLLRFEIQIAELAGDGKWTGQTFRFHVSPRN